MIYFICLFSTYLSKNLPSVKTTDLHDIYEAFTQLNLHPAVYTVTPYKPHETLSAPARSDQGIRGSSERKVCEASEVRRAVER